MDVSQDVDVKERIHFKVIRFMMESGSFRLRSCALLSRQRQCWRKTARLLDRSRVHSGRPVILMLVRRQSLEGDQWMCHCPSSLWNDFAIERLSVRSVQSLSVRGGINFCLSWPDHDAIEIQCCQKSGRERQCGIPHLCVYELRLHQEGAGSGRSAHAGGPSPLWFPALVQL